MDGVKFTEYMTEFERRVVQVGVDRGLLGAKTWLPIRSGRLTRTPFARLVGTRFSCDEPIVIEYFGLHKRSTGFMAKAQRMFEFKKGLNATLVNLSSVKDSHLADLAPDLLPDFPAFKQAIVDVRFEQK